MTNSTNTTSLLHSVTQKLEEDITSLCRSLPRSEIQRLIDLLAAEWTTRPSAGREVVQQVRDKTKPLPLTARETEVLTLLASGYTRDEIGIALSISRNTAATHVAAIYRKLEISSIAEATRIAIESGVVRLT